ncbi:MAG: hypothetical protein WAM92_03150 [Mycobacterium sp.]
MNVRLGWGVMLVGVVVLSACGPAADQPGKSSTTRPAATSTTTTTSVGAPATFSAKKWIDLDVGDCLADRPPTDPSVVTVTIVGCTAPHMSEVFFRGALTVDSAIPEVAGRECAAQFPKYTGQALDASGLAVTYLVDSNQDRTTFDPTAGPAPSTVICLLADANGHPLTAPARR